MNMLLTTYSLIVLISTMMILMSMLIFKKSAINKEKNSPFECGFDPKSSSRMPFSIRFFMISMIFLIFDVEIVLILPIIKTVSLMNPMNWLLNSYFFITILIIGLIHEWNQGAIKWND